MAKWISRTSLQIQQRWTQFKNFVGQMLKLQGYNYFSFNRSQLSYWVWQSRKWEDTTGKKDSYGLSGSKDILSGKPFLFCCKDNKLQIMKHRDDEIPIMGSGKNVQMLIGWGLYINADKHKNQKHLYIKIGLCILKTLII